MGESRGGEKAGISSPGKLQSTSVYDRVSCETGRKQDWEGCQTLAVVAKYYYNEI